MGRRMYSLTPRGLRRPLRLGPGSVACYSTNDCCRRVSPVAARSGDCLVSEPTAGTQPWRRELVVMPLSGPCPTANPTAGWVAVLAATHRGDGLAPGATPATGASGRRQTSSNTCSACRWTTSTRSRHGRLANLTRSACRCECRWTRVVFAIGVRALLDGWLGCEAAR